MTALKIIGVVERIDDYARNMAPARKADAAPPPRIAPVSLLPEMARDGSTDMVPHGARSAFVRRDPE